jgi:hypothetical protein
MTATQTCGGPLMPGHLQCEAARLLASPLGVSSVASLKKAGQPGALFLQSPPVRCSTALQSRAAGAHAGCCTSLLAGLLEHPCARQQQDARLPVPAR